MSAVRPLRTKPAPAEAATLVRALRADDLPEVAALHARVFGATPGRTPEALAEYFEEILFRNPWRDVEMPSLVATRNGAVTGFLGVVPRLMRLEGRTIRVAVCTQFMVDPRHRAELIAVQLLKSFFDGPQDLALADGANESARRMWVALGGSAPLLYSLHWLRPLRPARYVLSLVERRTPALRSLATIARSVATLADAAIARVPLNPLPGAEAAEWFEEPLQPATMHAYLADVMAGTTLQPQYDRPALEWLLDQAARKTRHGSLRARAVRDREQRLAGWFIHYARAGAVSEVVQIAARRGAFVPVLQRLVFDAWRLGSTALRGRLDPRYAQELSEQHCWMRRDCNWTLVHSSDAPLLSAIHQGRMFLSRLEGEWWMRFLEE